MNAVVTTRPTPAQLLADKIVLNATEVAYVLELTFARGAHAGEPDPRRVRMLVDNGDLFPVDPDQPAHRQTFAVAVVRRYLEKCERRERRIIPIAGVA